MELFTTVHGPCFSTIRRCNSSIVTHIPSRERCQLLQKRGLVAWAPLVWVQYSRSPDYTRIQCGDWQLALPFCNLITTIIPAVIGPGRWFGGSWRREETVVQHCHFSLEHFAPGQDRHHSNELFSECCLWERLLSKKLREIGEAHSQFLLWLSTPSFQPFARLQCALI